MQLVEKDVLEGRYNPHQAGQAGRQLQLFNLTLA